MWEKLINALVDLISKASIYLEVTTELKKRELGDRPEPSKISLAQPEDPWWHIEDRYKVGDLVKVRVTHLASFGAFVKLEDKVDGLIHISQLSDDYVARVSDVVNLGDIVEARVIKVDTDERRIGLSLKAVKNWATKEDEIPYDKPAESAEEPKEHWIDPKTAAKMLGITTTYLAHVAKMGWIPSRPRKGSKRLEYPESQLKGMTVEALRCRAALERGQSTKERRCRVVDIMSAPTCCRAYAAGTPKGANFSRICKARADGLLNIYTLMGVEYINLDEVARFTDWWDRNYHQMEKNATADFHESSDVYCVHENDLIWALTRDYNAQLNPTAEQIKAFDKVAKTLPSIRVKGVRFYRADAIQKIEDMRELLSHVEPVNA